MIKKFLFFAIILFFSLFIPALLADGFIHIYDKDMWELFDEEKQFCAINYKDGFQHMILTVNTAQELTGEKAVWIFPVPAKPDKTVINIMKGFPRFLGYDVQDQGHESIFIIFSMMRATQVYTFPFIVVFKIYMKSIGSIQNKIEGGIDGVAVYESIEKMGLTTELVSATDGYSLANYVISKGLTLPATSKSILDEYVGQEYSFVITWISDIEEFAQEQRKIERVDYGKPGNFIGVSVTFPTEKIYYPLKPTSVYGDKKIPTIIYVLDYVEPELYSGIKKDTKINYFFENKINVPGELRDFFVGYEKEPYTDYAIENQQVDFSVRNVKYTKIKINSPSKYLTQDLWIKVSTPLKIKLADLANRSGLLFGLIFFILSSCLASLFSGMIVFRNKPVSKIKFVLFGLTNFLTLIGFSIAAYIGKIDLRFTKSQEIEKNHVSFRKIITKTLIISLLISIFLFIVLFSYLYFYIFIPILIILYAITAASITPFVWGYYRNRKIMKFIILFTIFFILLTVIYQIFLHIILAI